MNNHINKIIALFLMAFAFSACQKERGISNETTGNQFLSSDGNIAKLYINAGAQQSNFGGFIDTYNGSIYLSKEVNNNFNNIDLYYRYTANGGNELYTTDATECAYNRDLELMNYAWPYHNSGTLYLLKTPTTAQIQQFKAINNNEQLNSFFQQVQNELGGIAQKRLINIAVNNIVLFKSTTKNTVSVLLVSSIAQSVQGRFAFDIKTDVSHKNTIPKQATTLLNNGKPADTLELSVSAANTDENFIDLLNRKVYKVANLPNASMASIGLVHVFNNTVNPNRHSFYTPTSSYAGANYVPAFWTWMNQQPNRKTIYLLRLDVNSTTTIQDRYNATGRSFDEVFHNNESLQEYHNYIAYQTSFSSHITTTEVGMVYRVYDTNTGNVGLMKILSLDLVNKKTKVAIKYSIPEVY